jgi:transcriptional regulator with XRE-family HTH domain
MANPDTYTPGLGEFIRAARLYIGLSKDGMAHRLGMSDRSYERIESCERDCPPGLLDSIDAIMDAFDTEVGAVIAAATDVGDKVITVSTEPREEWHRCVVGRAAVESRRVIPRAAL